MIHKGGRSHHQRPFDQEVVSPGGSFSKTDRAIRAFYLPFGTLADEAIIGRLSFNTGDFLTTEPADGLADIQMVSFTCGSNATTMVDPAAGTVGTISPFEGQAVPLPGAAWLLIGGLGALAGGRARRRADGSGRTTLLRDR